jgi:serine protease Do
MRLSAVAILTSVSRVRRAAPALALVAALGAPLVAAPALAASVKGPDTIADLVETLQDAVVNISTTQTAKVEKPENLPKLPEGSPFQDFFDEFFKKRGEGGGGDNTPGRRVQSQGSGFVVDASGIIVTNNHVIDGAEEITAIFHSGQRLKAELVGRDPKTDVAVLRVKPVKPLNAVKWADSDRARVGDWVVAIGNPLGLGGTVTVGVVSAKDRDIQAGPYDNFLQTDAAINKGNSGGPLFNMNGEVLGINTAIFSQSGGSIGIGFAQPSNTAAPVVDQLLKFGETRRGWLGVRIQGVTDDIAEGMGLKEAKGALVAGVTEKGPAETAGLLAGDVIVRFNGRAVGTHRDLTRMVADTAVDSEIEVVVLRKGVETTLKVKLGRLEDGEKLMAAKEPEKPAAKPEPTLPKVLGLSLSTLDKAARDKFKIKDKVAQGVVVAEVAPNTAAADKRLQAGDVILQIGQEPVTTPDEARTRIEALKKDGRKRALFLLASPEGDMRFVTVAVE